MPKLTKTVPKYRKHRATGQAIVTIAGKDNYLGPHGTEASKAIYDRLVGEFLAGGRRPAEEAVSEELIEPAVYDALKSVVGLATGRTAAKESIPVPPIALDVVERTIPHLSQVVADMVRLQLATGARPGEVCKVRPCDVDRSGDVWEYVVGGHKTEHHGRKRTVYLGPEAQAILAPYLLRSASTPCFSPAEAAEQSRAAKHARRTTPLSCGNRPGSNVKRRPRRQAGSMYATAAYGRAIVRACDLAFPAPDGTEGDELKAWKKANRWAPNQLRHTTGTAIRKRFGFGVSSMGFGVDQPVSSRLLSALTCKENMLLFLTR